MPIPNTPTLATPANNATGVAQTGTLTWNAATNALKYNVQVSLDPTFADKLLLAVNDTVAGTSDAYNLGAGTKYYWRVAAVNAGFASAYSAANNFTTTGAAPTVVPTVVFPANKATNLPAVLTLKVGRTAAASRYQWQIATLPTFTTFFANDSTADTTFAGVFTGGQTFYVRVRGINAEPRVEAEPPDLRMRSLSQPVALLGIADLQIIVAHPARINAAKILDSLPGIRGMLAGQPTHGAGRRSAQIIFR